VTVRVRPESNLILRRAMGLSLDGRTVMPLRIVE